jgi:uncharacterized membrane protein YfcA
VRLVGIGLVAGFFSAVFGVGGGIVLVPLLLLVLKYEPRVAAGTSLLAIGLTALAGTISYAARGEVKPAAAAVVGVPAMVGALAGTALQQRLTNRALSFAFAALLVAVAVRLLV